MKPCPFYPRDTRLTAAGAWAQGKGAHGSSRSWTVLYRKYPCTESNAVHSMELYRFLSFIADGYHHVMPAFSILAFTSHLAMSVGGVVLIRGNRPRLFLV